MPVGDMASYDDLGKVCKSAWVLEQGDYHIYIGTDVRQVRQVLSYGLEEDVVVEQLHEHLKPRKLGGFPSNGMLLCACTEDHSMGALIEPPADAKVGERVTFAGYEGEAATPAQVQKKKYLEACAPVGVGERGDV